MCWAFVMATLEGSQQNEEVIEKLHFHQSNNLFGKSVKLFLDVNAKLQAYLLNDLPAIKDNARRMTCCRCKFDEITHYKVL